MVSISHFPLSCLPLFFLLFFSVFFSLSYTPAAQRYPLQIPVSIRSSLKPSSAQLSINSQMVPVLQESRECVSSECTPLSTTKSDMLPLSLPKLKARNLVKETMHSLKQEGDSSTGQNVEMTPMPIPVATLTPQSNMLPVSHLEPNTPSLVKDSMDSLAQEAGTSITGRNVEVTSMPMPTRLHYGKPSSVSRKLKV